MADIVPTNKREKSLVAKGKSMARAKYNYEKGESEDIAKLMAGGYLGQMFTGGMPTPMLPNIPLPYTLLAANVLFGLGGRGTIRTLILGNAIAEAGYRGRTNQSNALMGMFGGGTP